MRFAQFLLSFTAVLLGSAQQPVAPIRLQAQPLPFTPNEFYVAAVTDNRPERGAIGRLVLRVGQPAQPVDLPNGVASSFNQFINQCLKQTRTRRPIAMRVRQCRFRETAAGSRVSGDFQYDVQFDLLGKDDAGRETATKLTEYRGSASYVRPVDQTAVLEQTLRQTLVASLKSLNEYMNREANRNEKLAKGLEVHFTDDDRITRDDTVHYNPDRPLTWDDFRATPRRGSHYAAEVFTSFAYEGRSSVRNSIIHLDLTLKGYVLKNSSWGRPEARTDYTLNHEQRHFDIVKIIVERFKRKIVPDSLTLEDYNSIVQYQFIESYRDMNHLQEQYDGETNHGLNQLAQERWNGKIDAELRKFGVKK